MIVDLYLQINGHRVSFAHEMGFVHQAILTIQNAADRNRTGTGITTHGILSPGRLPVPPLRHSIIIPYELS